MAGLNQKIKHQAKKELFWNNDFKPLVDGKQYNLTRKIRILSVLPEYPGLFFLRLTVCHAFYFPHCVWSCGANHPHHQGQGIDDLKFEALRIPDTIVFYNVPIGVFNNTSSVGVGSQGSQVIQTTGNFREKCP